MSHSTSCKVHTLSHVTQCMMLCFPVQDSFLNPPYSLVPSPINLTSPFPLHVQYLMYASHSHTWLECAIFHASNDSIWFLAMWICVCVLMVGVAPPHTSTAAPNGWHLAAGLSEGVCEGAEEKLSVVCLCVEGGRGASSFMLVMIKEVLIMLMTMVTGQYICWQGNSVKTPGVLNTLAPSQPICVTLGNKTVVRRDVRWE